MYGATHTRGHRVQSSSFIAAPPVPGGDPIPEPARIALSRDVHDRTVDLAAPVDRDERLERFRRAEQDDHWVEQRGVGQVVDGEVLGGAAASALCAVAADHVGAYPSPFAGLPEPHLWPRVPACVRLFAVRWCAVSAARTATSWHRLAALDALVARIELARAER